VDMDMDGIHGKPKKCQSRAGIITGL